MNSQSFHRVRSIRTTGVSHNNANALTIVIQCEAYQGEKFDQEITLFGLPTNVADSLESLLGEGSKIDEAAIRADERRKVKAEIAAQIAEDYPF